MSPTTDPVIVTVRVSIALEVDGEAIGESRSFTATMRDDEDPNPAAMLAVQTFIVELQRAMLATARAVEQPR